jgi:Protein of unknown function (DUF2752)
MLVMSSVLDRALRRMPPLLAPGAVLLAVVLGLAFVGTVDPNEPGHYPTCPWLYLTGTYCPGCGSLRMFHALANGEFVTAFGFNPLAFATLPVFAFSWVAWTLRAARRRPRRWLPHPAVLWGFAAVFVVFWVVRNLPFGQALAP